MRAASASLLVFLGLVLGTPAAWAQDDEDDAELDDVPETVLLFPLAAKKSVDDTELLKAADEAVRTMAAEVAGEGLALEKRARSARCVTSARCVGKLTKRAKADKGLAFLLDASGEGIKVSYLVASPGGEELFRGEREVPSSDVAAVTEQLSQLVRELLSPGSLSGLLKVPGLDERAYVLVDGLPTAAAALAEGIQLPLGAHRVRVLRAERDPEVHEVDIKFGEESVVEVEEPPPPPKQVVLTDLPLWPSLVGAGVTTAAVLVALVTGLDLLLSYSIVQSEATGALQGVDQQKELPAFVARQPALMRARAAARTDAFLLAAAMAISAAAATATVVLITAWAVGGKSAEEAGPLDEGAGGEDAAGEAPAVLNGEGDEEQAPDEIVDEEPAAPSDEGSE